MYEYVITFDREVQLFWRGKWTGASILFFLNRYLGLLSPVLTALELVRMSDKVRSEARLAILLSSR